MIIDFLKTIKFKKIKNGHFLHFATMYVPQTVISNSEKLTHHTEQDFELLVYYDWDIFEGQNVFPCV